MPTMQTSVSEKEGPRRRRRRCVSTSTSRHRGVSRSRAARNRGTRKNPNHSDRFRLFLHDRPRDRHLADKSIVSKSAADTQITRVVNLVFLRKAQKGRIGLTSRFQECQGQCHARLAEIRLAAVNVRRHAVCCGAGMRDKKCVVTCYETP